MWFVADLVGPPEHVRARAVHGAVPHRAGPGQPGPGAQGGGGEYRPHDDEENTSTLVPLLLDMTALRGVT